MSTKQVVISAVLVAFAASSAMAATIQVSTTIKVTSGSYNGNNNTYVSKGLGDGGQGESQKPIFRCENGASISNVIIGAPAADGIHFYKGCTLNNVRWTDVGEDAATIKSAGNVTINGGSTTKSADKTFQVNAGATMTINNHTGSSFGCFLRQNGGTSYKCTFNVRNCRLSNGSYGIRTDSSSTSINTGGTTFSNVKTPIKRP